jgi:hypothetical protein
MNPASVKRSPKSRKRNHFQYKKQHPGRFWQASWFEDFAAGEKFHVFDYRLKAPRRKTCGQTVGTAESAVAFLC